MRLITGAMGVIRAIRALGGGIRVWGAALNLPQIVGGVIFVGMIEGQLILVTVLITLIVAGQIPRRSHFSRLIGLCHLRWLVLLLLLTWRIVGFEHSAVVKGWLVYVAVTILVSLIFDAWDVARYLKGDTRFAWAENKSEQ